MKLGLDSEQKINNKIRYDLWFFLENKSNAYSLIDHKKLHYINTWGKNTAEIFMDEWL